MKTVRSWFVAGVLSAAVGFAGCAKKPVGETGQAKGEPPSNAAGPASNEQKRLPISDLPATLRHDGFEYYGLGNDQVTKIEVAPPVGEEKQSGTTTFRLTHVGGGDAVFSVDRTGALANIGPQELLVKPDGVYTVRFGETTLDPPQLEMPAKVGRGATWTGKATVKLADGSEFSMDNRFKVVGMEKVKTKLGEQEALRVDGTGTNVVQGEKLAVSMKAWFVRGRGLVKMELDTTTAQGEKKSSRLEVVQ